jgi:hypothetical protein
VDVSGLVAHFNYGPLTVQRAGPPTLSALGAFQDATPVPVTLNPVGVHTLNGRELEQVPEADRLREHIKIYTKVRLYVADGDKVADRLEWRGRTYRVISVKDYELQAGAYLSIAVLEGP